ncbi:MAG TPA: 50S ribosomal protein L23 [bacterium]|jgi:large subunit ribosomal protein L23|nr:50S ribosomal protein L23 [bacterium]
MERLYEIIKRPLMTEKSTVAGEKQNAYVFEVVNDADKTEIKDAVEKLFEVKVKSVNTQVVHGKVKRVSGRYYGKRSKWKKAVVTLQEGHKIQLVEGV